MNRVLIEVRIELRSTSSSFTSIVLTGLGTGVHSRWLELAVVLHVFASGALTAENCAFCSIPLMLDLVDRFSPNRKAQV